MASHHLAPFPEELLAAKKQIREQARSYGLDFFPVIFEMCDYEQMNQIAETIYPHPATQAAYERLYPIFEAIYRALEPIYEQISEIDSIS